MKINIPFWPGQKLYVELDRELWFNQVKNGRITYLFSLGYYDMEDDEMVGRAFTFVFLTLRMGMVWRVANK